MPSTRLYSGFVKINPDEPFRFELDELEIEKVHSDGMIETKCPYFTSSTYSSYYFGGNSGSKLNVEYKITDYILILYSTDKNQCSMFLARKRLELESLIEKMRERFRESKIEINVADIKDID